MFAETALVLSFTGRLATTPFTRALPLPNASSQALSFSPRRPM